MADVKLNVTAENGTLTILNGKALDPVAPEVVELSGDIKTVSAFLKLRKENGVGSQMVDPNKAVLIVDKHNGTIELLTDPENKYGASVTGSLTPSEELAQFFINENKTFTREELVKLLKFSRLYFKSPAKHSDIVTAFQKLTSSIQVSNNASSDERGNKASEYIKNVTTNAPTEFILNVPIYKGFPPATFRVEICLDVTDNSARFWFQSVELHELMLTMTEKIFEEELKAAEGMVIVYK